MKMAVTTPLKATDLSKEDMVLLSDALEQAVASAQRQQNMKGKTPMMKEVYAKHEQTLRALQVKLNGG
jgi:type IV secretory pathway protease TraF